MTMENLGWGLQITALGMGLVFALLALLWGLLTLVLRLDRAPEATTLQGQASDTVALASADTTGGTLGGADGKRAMQSSADALDPDLIAAIVVATLAHKAIRRREAAPVMRSYWPGSLLFASRWVAVGRSRQNRSWQRRGK